MRKLFGIRMFYFANKTWNCAKRITITITQRSEPSFELNFKPFLYKQGYAQ
jgi:hypothetical protein